FYFLDLSLHRLYTLSLHDALPISENDGWGSDLMYTAPYERDPPASTEESPMPERWKQDVVEPTRRLDRMSWMLASSVLALAHELDRKSTRLNSSHVSISYAVFCLK